MTKKKDAARVAKHEARRAEYEEKREAITTKFQQVPRKRTEALIALKDQYRDVA